MLLTFSNLYPRPDAPGRGQFNVQLFEALHRQLGGRPLLNVCPVPAWQPWRAPAIRGWLAPLGQPFPTRYAPVPHIPVLGRSSAWRLHRRALERALEPGESPEAVFAAWLYPDGVAALHFARERGVPACVLVQGSDTFHLASPARRRAIVEASRSARGLVCVCAMLADRLVRAGVEPSAVLVAPNGVDSSLFRFRPRAGARAALAGRGLWPSGWAPDDRLVLFVGNLVPVKGPDLLVGALAARRQAGEETPRVVLVGDGPLRARLQAAARRAGLGETVCFAGVRPHAEVAEWMNAADCLCLPSRSEGMPNAVVEALASGLPVAAADVGACRDLLRGEPSCRIFAPGKGEALAEAVGHALGGGEDRAALAARQGPRYSWDAQARVILNLLGLGWTERTAYGNGSGRA